MSFAANILKSSTESNPELKVGTTEKPVADNKDNLKPNNLNSCITNEGLIITCDGSNKITVQNSKTPNVPVKQPKAFEFPCDQVLSLGAERVMCANSTGKREEQRVVILNFKEKKLEYNKKLNRVTLNKAIILENRLVYIPDTHRPRDGKLYPFEIINLNDLEDVMYSPTTVADKKDQPHSLTRISDNEFSFTNPNGDVVCCKLLADRIGIRQPAAKKERVPISDELAAMMFGMLRAPSTYFKSKAAQNMGKQIQDKEMQNNKQNQSSSP